jgi:hypothetical protein
LIWLVDWLGGVAVAQECRMKFKVEAECTPEEARTFLGLPDLAPLNEHMVEEMKRRVDANISMLNPEDFLKNWMTLGGQTQEQFMRLMTAAASASLRGGPGKG